jgi:hypothetical protein
MKPSDQFRRSPVIRHSLAGVDRDFCLNQALKAKATGKGMKFPTHESSLEEV